MNMIATHEPDHQRPRMAEPPLLARVAHAMYWMSRYIERAEHIARVLLHNGLVLIDVGDLAPELKRRLWLGVLQTFSVHDEPGAIRALDAPEDAIDSAVCAFMARDITNPTSLLNCVTLARENARGIREQISAEMWEDLNTLYWSLQGDDASARFVDSPHDALRQITNGSMLFQGLTDQTLGHGQAWLFAQVGKHLERLDMTCRIVENKFTALRSIEQTLDAPVRNIHWMSVLRSCCSIELYRRTQVGEIDPDRIAAFITLQPHFPRSIRYCAAAAHEAMCQVRIGADPGRPSLAERILGRLDTQLEYAEPAEITAAGVEAYLRGIRFAAAEAADALSKSFFMC